MGPRVTALRFFLATTHIGLIVVLYNRSPTPIPIRRTSYVTKPPPPERPPAPRAFTHCFASFLRDTPAFSATDWSPPDMFLANTTLFLTTPHTHIKTSIKIMYHDPKHRSHTCTTTSCGPPLLPLACFACFSPQVTGFPLRSKRTPTSRLQASPVGAEAWLVSDEVG